MLCFICAMKKLWLLLRGTRAENVLWLVEEEKL